MNPYDVYGEYLVAEGSRIERVNPYAGAPGWEAAWQPLRTATAFRGLGDVPIIPGSGGQLLPTEQPQQDQLTKFAYLALMFAGGFAAGKAMAPSSDAENKYGIMGALLGLFAGPLGLGILGGIALTTGRSESSGHRGGYGYAR